MGDYTEIMKYSREVLEGFFKWQMISCLRHFPDEYNAEDEAKTFAFSRPRANGFVTFQTKWRGKRFFWIKDGEAKEIDPVECYLKTLPNDSEIIKTREAKKTRVSEPGPQFKKQIQKMLKNKS